jgi:FkbM family methyltransferase
MHYNYDTTNALPPNSIDIPFSTIFIDKICNEYFDKDSHIIFMEIGALDGKDSNYVKMQYTNSTVYCIEGSKQIFDTILSKKNYGFNIYNTCIYKHDGEITYHMKNNLYSGIHGVYDRGQMYGGDVDIVKCQTLDTFCAENGIDHIDILKIDVEGATFDVLNNMKMLNKIKIMHIETEDYPFFDGQILDKDVENLLKDNGFKLICKTGYNPTEQGKQYDSVWVNMEI